MVSGAPGAGKSTLALPLAQALAMPLLSKDVIKERLADVLGQRAEPEVWTQALGSASMELIWTLAALSPAVVLEANFRPRNPYERRMLGGLGGRLVSIVSEGPMFRSDAKATEFREWLDTYEAWIEELPEDWCKGGTAFRATGCKANIVVVSKAAA